MVEGRDRLTIPGTGSRPELGRGTGARCLGRERADGYPGRSVAHVAVVNDGYDAHGCDVLGGTGEALACWSRVRVDRDWSTEEADVGAVAVGGPRHLGLRAADERRWFVDGVRRPDLDGCLDVDVAATR